jgi:hypothetical protein
MSWFITIIELAVLAVGYHSLGFIISYKRSVSYFINGTSLNLFEQANHYSLLLIVN